MSDVAQGGATVFTELGLSLFPRRGAAAFWLNLHPSGEGDLATRHAACPVLRGSKWGRDASTVTLTLRTGFPTRRDPSSCWVISTGHERSEGLSLRVMAELTDNIILNCSDFIVAPSRYLSIA